jgi:pyridoxamine 5'-phosphate oxidase-like protein
MLAQRVTSLRSPSLLSRSVRVHWCIWVAWVAYQPRRENSQGFPFGSVMPYGLDDHGRPIFLISTVAMHTQNLQADSRASLLVTQEDTEGEPRP